MSLKDTGSMKIEGRGGLLFQLLASEWVHLFFIIVITVFFRFYQLDLVPGAFLSDEVVETVDALKIQQVGPQIFLTTNYGREPLFTHLLALAFYIWEPQALVLRSIGALAGVLAVIAAYFLVKEMFKGVAPGQARWLAALTALGYATAYWQIHLTRMGLRHTLLPLMMTLTFYFLWRGFNSTSRAAFIIAGLMLGGSLYTYPAARFIPVLIGLFLFLEGIVRWLEGHHSRALWRSHWQNLLLMAVIALLVFGPLGYYFLFTAPQQFVNRASRISILNQTLNQGSPLGALANSIIGNLQGLAIHGDEYGNYNLPGRPIFDPLLALAFVVGLVLALKRFRDPPYLLTALWWFVMLVPAFLVSDWVPTFKRAVAMAPGIYILPAIAWVTFSRNLFQWRAVKNYRRQRLAWGVVILAPLIVFTLVGLKTYRDYFLIWGPSDPQYFAKVTYQKIAEQMAREGTSDEVWIFPTDRRNKLRLYNYTDDGFFDFLGYRRLPARVLIPVDEQQMFDRLSEAVKGHSKIVLVNVTKGYEWEADQKQLLSFLLEKYGVLESVYTDTQHNFQLLHYQLDSPDTTFRASDQWRSLDIDFGGLLTLRQSAYGDTSGTTSLDSSQVPSGEKIWITLNWQAINPMSEDYQVSLRLVDKAGQIVSQLDKPLFNVWHLGTSGWQPGEVVDDYYLLPLEPATVPDDYRLEVLVYASTDLRPLPVNVANDMGTTAEIGDIQIIPALSPPPLSIDRVIDTLLTPGLELITYSDLPTDLQAGDKFDLALLWRSLTKPEQALTLNLTLAGQKKDWGILHNLTIGSESFPTSAWRARELINQRLMIRIPPEVTTGTYTLNLSLAGAYKVITLGTIDVQNHPHSFELPSPIQHPLNLSIEDQVKLAGFDLNSTGPESIELTLYWQALRVIPQSYTAFVHLLDEQGGIVAQRDQIPMSGQAPTTSWLPGEVIADQYSFAVPMGHYQLEAGLYDSNTGQRLIMPDAPDYRLGSVDVLN